ncbi:MAG TPA: Uma2 family endonuclease [Tepidisphaeraceae bacterium]|nr:Uma2 family endonuclease [Tepidisphaeraceae bacterium]
MGDLPLERIVMDPWIGMATERDLLKLIEGADKRLCELVDGTLVEKPVGIKESRIAIKLSTALSVFLAGKKLGFVSGEAGPFRLRAKRVRLPDVAYTSHASLPAPDSADAPILPSPPTIAAEVISESNTTAEMRRKIREYFESGTRLVSLIYPKTRTIAVFESASDEPARVLTEGETLDAAGILPGFSITVAALFDLS